MSVSEDEGYELSKEYNIGFNYPVYILANSRGEVINQWVGYNGGATNLIRTLENALKNLTPINERVARFKSNPILREAQFLAGYFSKTGRNLESRDYYREAAKLGGGDRYDYVYEIFNQTANAAWNEMLPLDSVFPAADAVLASNRVMKTKYIKVAQIMTRLARKLGRVEEAKKYLQAGMETALGPENNKKDPTYRLLMADYQLFIEKNPSIATQIKKIVMGDGWEEDRDKFYEYAKWCLEREINLEEAEMYARKAINMVEPGKYRARVYGTVAEICFARGNVEEAIRMINFAIDENPADRLYQNQLIRFQEEK